MRWGILLEFALVMALAVLVHFLLVFYWSG